MRVREVIGRSMARLKRCVLRRARENCRCVDAKGRVASYARDKSTRSDACGRVRCIRRQGARFPGLGVNRSGRGNCFLKKRRPREISNTRPYASRDHPTHTAPAIQSPPDPRVAARQSANKPKASKRHRHDKNTTTSPDYSPRTDSASSPPAASSASSARAFGRQASAAARAPAGPAPRGPPPSEPRGAAPRAAACNAPSRCQKSQHVQ